MPKWIDSVAIRALFLLGHDVVALFLSVMLVYRFRLDYQPPSVFEWHVLAVALVTVLMLYLLNAYRIDHKVSPIPIILRTFVAVIISGLVIASWVYVIRPRTAIPVLWRGNLPFSLALFAFWASLFRYSASVCYHKWWPRNRW